MSEQIIRNIPRDLMKEKAKRIESAVWKLKSRGAKFSDIELVEYPHEDCTQAVDKKTGKSIRVNNPAINFADPC